MSVYLRALYGLQFTVLQNNMVEVLEVRLFQFLFNYNSTG